MATETVNVNATAITAAITAEAAARVAGDAASVSTAASDATTKANAAQAAAIAAANAHSDGLVEQATEARRGTLGIATQAEVEDAVSTNDIDAITPKKWWQAFAYATAQTAFKALVRAIDLTGYIVGANTALAATDTFLGAFQKVQGQINAINTAVSANTTAISGKLTASNNLSDVASVATARTNLGIFTPVFKTVDESKISDVALAEDSALKFTMSANKVYAFRCVVIFETTGLADIKFRHAGPASPTRVRIARDSIISAGSVYGTVFVDTAYSAADINISGTVDGSGLFRCEGTISNGANVGDFQLLWAQRSSDANNTTVLAGSYLEWLQIP